MVNTEQENEVVLDIPVLLFILKKNIVWIILTSFAGALVAGAITTFLIDPAYIHTQRYIFTINKNLARAVSLFEHNEVKIVGCVINSTDPQNTNHPYLYSYKYKITQGRKHLLKRKDCNAHLYSGRAC